VRNVRGSYQSDQTKLGALQPHRPSLSWTNTRHAAETAQNDPTQPNPGPQTKPIAGFGLRYNSDCAVTKTLFRAAAAVILPPVVRETVNGIVLQRLALLCENRNTP
jgi:hypothetical protein